MALRISMSSVPCSRSICFATDSPCVSRRENSSSLLDCQGERLSALGNYLSSKTQPQRQLPRPWTCVCRSLIGLQRAKSLRVADVNRRRRIVGVIQNVRESGFESQLGLLAQQECFPQPS